MAQTIDKTAFLMGYWDGVKTRAHMSDKQANRYLKGLPAVAIRSYQQGREDGVNGDSTRKDALSAVSSAV